MCVPYASYAFYALYRSRFSERSDIVFACTCTPSIYAPTVEVAVVSTPDKYSSERRDLDLALTFSMMENSCSQQYLLPKREIFLRASLTKFGDVSSETYLA